MSIVMKIASSVPVLLLLAALLAPGAGFAAQQEIVGAKVDETSRDSPYINNATTAMDRAIDRLEGESVDKDATPSRPYIIRRFYSNGGSTYLFVFPHAADEPPLHRD
jgi:hypothetical protein